MCAVQTVFVTSAASPVVPADGGCPVRRRPQAPKHCWGGRGAPSPRAPGDLVSPLGFPHCSNPTASWLPGWRRRSRKLHNGLCWLPLPRWLMGGAGHGRGLALVVVPAPELGPWETVG